jgi:glycosyltransferase involved in cell wall biosynthesis
VRVLCLFSTLAVGGAERQRELLVLELRRRGFVPFVATLRHQGRHFEALRRQGVPVQFIGMRSRVDSASIARAYRLWRLRPDIVFTSSVDAQVLGHLVALRAGARHVTVEHGGPGLPRALHRRLLVRMVAPWIDRVVAVSATQLDELRSLGFRPERITVIPNGIPALSTTQPRAAVRAELGIADDDVVALLVAGLRPEKRADVFVEAVRHAHAREPRLRGVIAGDGAELERVRSLAAASPDVVRVLGERDDVPDLIGAADVVCLTSAFEGLPITVLEAMALSRPLVATRVGGIPDAVADGRTGKLVPPGDVDAFADALVALAEAPVVRAAMGEAGRNAYLERFTLEDMVQRYVDVLGTLGDRQVLTKGREVPAR